MVKRDTIAFAGSESRDGLRKWNREVGIAVDSDEVTTIGARTKVHPKQDGRVVDGETGTGGADVLE